MAVRCIERGLYDEAVFRTNDYIQRFGDDARAQFVLGLVQHKQKNYELARPHFERALKEEPEFQATAYFHAYCLYYLGEPSGARRSFEAYLKRSPDAADAHFGLGLVELEEDRLDEAHAEFTLAFELTMKAIERQPERYDLRADLAKAQARLSDIDVRRGQLEEAREKLLMATRLWPDHYEAWHKLGRVLQRLGEDDAAARAFKKHDEVRERLRPRTPAPESPP